MGDESTETGRKAEPAGGEERQAPLREVFGPEMRRKLETLRGIAGRLERAGVDYTIGGSGMLLGLGLADSVRDWDLTTEADESEIRRALAGLELIDTGGPSDFYATGYKLLVAGTEPEVEIIGKFAIRADKGICRLPSLPGGVWGGLRIASPEIWWAAYALMGRTGKAELLERYLHTYGADEAALSELRKQPLPRELGKRLEKLSVPAGNGRP
ncbi:hypothetical protein QWJ34_19135 [Saccharibacillus sp. CPCC 101409]|uniref:hypothetical protein n=1 Tax=Saccharibacillus sp. CPCC 101409 TaxID=3058041 RepID=UPI002673CA83|nr:hypothetical protein [Saccharibacillus sp. CPCC 101409]MDO3411885.1 hypothetical protein [Saccharibacillus sp. CPCC 101409]